MKIFINYMHNGISCQAVLKALKKDYPDKFVTVVIGVAGQLLFSSYHISGQWHGNTPIEMETPAMYMPTVGANFASAIALGAFGYSHWGYVFFGAGFLSWMSLPLSPALK